MFVINIIVTQTQNPNISEISLRGLLNQGGNRIQSGPTHPIASNANYGSTLGMMPNQHLDIQNPQQGLPAQGLQMGGPFGANSQHNQMMVQRTLQQNQQPFLGVPNTNPTFQQQNQHQQQRMQQHNVATNMVPRGMLPTVSNIHKKVKAFDRHKRFFSRTICVLDNRLATLIIRNKLINQPNGIFHSRCSR